MGKTGKFCLAVSAGGFSLLEAKKNSMRRMVQMAVAIAAVVASTQTEEGGPCAALKELEEDYFTRAEPQIFNIVDPGTSIQCTWNPEEKRVCQGVSGRCETHDEL